MPADFLPNILGGLTEALVGAFFGFLIAYFAFGLQRTQKTIEYDVFSMPLLRFKPTQKHALSVSVDKWVLTNEEADKGIPVPIDSAYGFEINLLNIGNVPIEKPNIEIRLDESAKIVEYETQPTSRPGYEVEAQKDTLEPNVLRVLVPFVNRRERVLIRVISTGNASRKCKVDVVGLGIKQRSRRPTRGLIWTMGGLLIALVMFSIAMFVLYSPGLLPSSIITFLGGRIETQTQTTTMVVYPLWLNAMVIIMLLVVMGVFMVRMLRSFVLEMRQKRLFPVRRWDWEEPSHRID